MAVGIKAVQKAEEITEKALLQAARRVNDRTDQTVVGGRPGSGKSAFVKTARENGEKAIDGDTTISIDRGVMRGGQPKMRWDEAKLVAELSKSKQLYVCGIAINIFDLDILRHFDRRIWLDLSLPDLLKRSDQRVEEWKQIIREGKPAGTRPFGETKEERDLLTSSFDLMRNAAIEAHFKLIKVTLDMTRQEVYDLISVKRQ